MSVVANALRLRRFEGSDEPAPVRPAQVDWTVHRRLRVGGLLWGALAGLLLVGVYLVTLGLANSLEHAVTDLRRLWYWMAPLVLGFSVQVGLFAYARRAARVGAGATHAHGVVASGGASTLSMVACCAHHLADVLPVIGLAGAAALLATYQGVFLLLGVLSNGIGLVYVLGLLHRHGLFPKRRSLLSLVARLPFDRALVPAIALSVVVFILVLWRQVTWG